MTRDTLQPRRRGRPARTAVDEIRTQIWFNAVSAASGGLSAPALARQFADSKLQARRELWMQYRDGKTSPKDKPPQKRQARITGSRIPATAAGLGRVQQVEQRYPGTAWWFRHPLWEILAANRGRIDKDLHLAERISKDVLDPLGPYAMGVYGIPRGSNYLLLPEVQKLLEQFVGRDAFDALTMLLYAFHGSSWPIYEEWQGAAHAYLKLAKQVARLDAVFPVHHALFDFIEPRYFIYPTFSYYPFARAARLTRAKKKKLKELRKAEWRFYLPSSS